jgi:phosphoglycerol transferase MdoB-like AlkP superfamily enzyme
LLTLFRRQGYETIGFYPSLSWQWPERRFYGFDTFLDGRELDYRGPHLGYWWIPDQYAIARFEQLRPVTAQSPPRLLFYPSITSHFPFAPVPPYQADWQRVLGDQPFDRADVERALAEQPRWFDMLPSYLRMIEYDYRWLTGWLQQPSARDFVMVVLGDHQPTSNISGDGASWEVPVHVIASNPRLLQRFVALGFSDGLQPRRPALGAMHEFTRTLLRAFSSQGDA